LETIAHQVSGSVRTRSGILVIQVVRARLCRSKPLPHPCSPVARHFATSEFVAEEATTANRGPPCYIRHRKRLAGEHESIPFDGEGFDARGGMFKLRLAGYWIDDGAYQGASARLRGVLAAPMYGRKNTASRHLSADPDARDH
jgi:hypothetical protein